MVSRVIVRLIVSITVFTTAFSVFAEADLGTIAFPTSGTPEAQRHFERGVLFLHSFEYGDAREAFEKARELAPSYAMAYWGEAMTYNHPIWLEEDFDAGRAALERLGKTAADRLAEAPTEREKSYLRAVEILFGEGDKVTRDQAYAEAMQSIMERYPDDLEAAAFYALSLLGTCHEGRDFATYMKAAAIADFVFDQNPRHPGAAHYLIHATDDPTHAPLGLRAARAYAEIAPAAGHALHMPSHIFLALGMWDEVVASNEASWNAVAQRVEKEGLPVESHTYHALIWWHYGLLQQGLHKEAKALLDGMASDYAASGSKRTASHLALMRAAYAVDTGRLSDLPPAPAFDDLDLATAASIDFTAGLVALDGGDTDGATAAAESILERVAQALTKERTRRDASYARVGSVRTASAEIMALELQALAAEKRGDLETALVKANEAATRQEDASFGFGPPVPAKPARELLGEILLRAEREGEAHAQLVRALERTPRRASALAALSKATRLAAGRPTSEKQPQKSSSD